MKNLLYAIFALFLITSCSEDKDSEELKTNYDDLIVTTSVYNIGLDVVTVVVSTNVSTATSMRQTILYREYGAGVFLESTSGFLTNLTRGKKHEVKSRVTINGNNYYSQTIRFCTKGYYDNNEVSGDVDEYNKKYKILFPSGGQDISEFVQPLIAYAKVGQDSIEIKNMSYVDNIISFEIDAETQQFFENDTEYISHKVFTIGFFSGDYYQNLITPRSSAIYNGEETNKWNFFNKKPRFDSYMKYEYSYCANLDNPKAFIDFYGRFWGHPGDVGNYDPRTGISNIPDNLTIRLTNINNPSIEKVYFTDDSEDFSSLLRDCELDGFALGHDGIISSLSSFHSGSYLRLNYNKNFIIAGDYTVTFAVQKDNEVYISDKFTIVIE